MHRLTWPHWRLGAKGSDRLVFVVENIEHRVEFCKLHQVVNPLGQFQQLKFSVAIGDGSAGGNQLAQAGAINVGDLAEIK